MKAALFRWAEQQGAKSVKKKARFLGMPQSLVCYWRYTDRKPSLQRLFELSFRNGLPILDICRGNLAITASEKPHRKIQRAWSFKTLTPAQKIELPKRLAAIAARDYPPCVQHAAKELGVARGTLEALAPQLCEEISKRSTGQRSLIGTVRFLRFQNKVARCVKTKVDAGKAPTLRDVVSCLSDPGVLRSPKHRQHARAEIKKAKLQLFGPNPPP